MPRRAQRDQYRLADIAAHMSLLCDVEEETIVLEGIAHIENSAVSHETEHSGSVSYANRCECASEERDALNTVMQDFAREAGIANTDSANSAVSDDADTRARAALPELRRTNFWGMPTWRAQSGNRHDHNKLKSPNLPKNRG